MPLSAYWEGQFPESKRLCLDVRAASTVESFHDLLGERAGDSWDGGDGLNACL